MVGRPGMALFATRIGTRGSDKQYNAPEELPEAGIFKHLRDPCVNGLHPGLPGIAVRCIGQIIDSCSGPFLRLERKMSSEVGRKQFPGSKLSLTRCIERELCDAGRDEQGRGCQEHCQEAEL